MTDTILDRAEVLATRSTPDGLPAMCRALHEIASHEVEHQRLRWAVDAAFEDFEQARRLLWAAEDNLSRHVGTVGALAGHIIANARIELENAVMKSDTYEGLLSALGDQSYETAASLLADHIDFTLETATEWRDVFDRADQLVRDLKSLRERCRVTTAAG